MMTEYAPNLPEWVLKEKPHITHCKYCGAEAYLKGTPDFEWWTYKIGCSKYCKDSTENHTRLQRYEIKELIEKWNDLNKECEDE